MRLRSHILMNMKVNVESIPLTKWIADELEVIILHHSILG